MSRFKQLPPILVRGMIALVALGLAAGVLGVAYFEVGRSQTVVLPDPTGPYPVGRTAFDWVDTSREDTLAPSSGIRRELLVWVWYPATSSGQGTATAEYLPADWRKALEQDRGEGGHAQHHRQIDDEAGMGFRACHRDLKPPGRAG